MKTGIEAIVEQRQIEFKVKETPSWKDEKYYKVIKSKYRTIKEFNDVKYILDLEEHIKYLKHLLAKTEKRSKKNQE